MREQFQRVRSDFSNDSGLPFGRLLTKDYVLAVLGQEGHQYRSRVFCPLVTLWGWLSQCLSQDKSLNDAVARILAHWVAAGLPACSASSASYSNARRRFPEGAMVRMAREIGQGVHSDAPHHSLWRGRSVYLADGTGLSMPDTLENQAQYPQQDVHRKGLGFPLIRAVALISLSTGAIVDMAFGKSLGKGTGESALLRSMMGTLKRGDVVVADKYHGNYFALAMLASRGVDAICTIKSSNRLAAGQTVLLKPKPPEWMDDHTHESLPNALPVRQIDVDVEDRDGSPKTVTIITTITDPRVSDQEISDLYLQRWNCEVDLRSIKCSMQMDELRAKTPDMVRKEIWCHVLAYNLLRGVMVQSASKLDVLPRQLSVKGAMQMVESFTPAMMNCESQLALYDAFLVAIATHRVGNRPGRQEPRFRKRRHRWTQYMTIPRHKSFRRLASDAVA